MCSLVEREWTLSSGKEALGCVRRDGSREMGWDCGKERDVRETGHELELVLDLAALVGAVLLGSGVC
jgi:hypothetical protein